MARTYFELVERLLADLCREKNWKLFSGKDTCIRVQVSSWAHIDIPLYAAPEAQFTQIMEKALLENRSLTRVLRAHDSAALSESVEFGEMPEQVWEDLDCIVMATRCGEWRSSDPEAVAKWFNDKVEEHTEQLRRVCRHLKAWRDYHWKEGGPTSIAIMIAVAQTFEAHPRRDDLALEEAARTLASALSGEIRERVIDDGAEDFSKRLSDEDKSKATRLALELAQTLRDSRLLAAHQKEQAIMQVQRCLGPRIPRDADLIEIDNEMDEIRATPVRKVAAPVVLATSAG